MLGYATYSNLSICREQTNLSDIRVRRTAIEKQVSSFSINAEITTPYTQTHFPPKKEKERKVIKEVNRPDLTSHYICPKL